MSDTLHAVIRTLHMTGAFVAFTGAPIALLALKGGRRHVLAGRAFVLGMWLVVPMGLIVRYPPDVESILIGTLLFFFTITGFLAPRVAGGSAAAYRWDRALTATGSAASLGLLAIYAARFDEGAIALEWLIDGTLGMAVAVPHWRWRGPAQPGRWRVEHLTALLAAYTVAWTFMVVLYGEPIPLAVRMLAPGLAGGVGIFWARRRFGGPTVAARRGALTGVA